VWELKLQQNRSNLGQMEQYNTSHEKGIFVWMIRLSLLPSLITVLYWVEEYPSKLRLWI
jgi:hypothetical protein